MISKNLEKILFITGGITLIPQILNPLKLDGTAASYVQLSLTLISLLSLGGFTSSVVYRDYKKKEEYKKIKL